MRKKTRKKILGFALTVALGLGTLSGTGYTAYAEVDVPGNDVVLEDGNDKISFEDVPEDAYYYKPVIWAVTDEITSGVDENHFKPFTVCNRAQTITFMWRAAGCPEPESTVNPFTDVNEEDFFYEAVLWGVENKIVAGKNENTFAPKDPCTRSQVVMFLWRNAGCPEPVSAENPFADVTEGSAYYNAILWAVENNITNGINPTTFGVKKSCVRAQLITFLYNALADRITRMLDSMTLEEKVGQMMIVSFRKWQADGEKTSTNIIELNDEIRGCLERNHFGGTILFAENNKNAEQTYKLIADLQASNQKGSDIPLFVSVDQEGGAVARLGFGTTGVGNMALGATGNPEYAYEMASVFGEELQALGYNSDYAPVVDVNNNPKNPVIGNRSFSDSPEVVSAFGNAFMNGLGEAGIVATLKHFPGHGDTETDSHTGFPLINKSYEELKDFELIPYQAAIDNGVEMIMTAHIQYPKIENETYTSISTKEEVYIPATMSHRILTDILRDDMGYEGVVVTDALDMGAIRDNFEFEDVLTMTINAGADMLMLPLITDRALYEQADGAVAKTVALVESGEISEERIDESVRRILTLKEKRGILDTTDFTVSEDRAAHVNSFVGCKENRDKAWEIATKSLTLLSNENEAYPLKNPDGDTLILFADSCASRIGYGLMAKQILGKENITVMANSRSNKEECIDAAKNAENVILINRFYSEACLDPNTEDGFSTETFDDIIAARHEEEKPVIVISCQLPYDAARFTDADAMILTYCTNVVRQPLPESGEGSAYSPNLAAAIVACFEGTELAGKLPVNLPKLDENYKLTNEILYEREVE